MFAAGEEARAAAVRTTVPARALKFLPPVLELCTDAVDPGLIHPVHQELPIAESTDTGQHLSQNGPVEACVPLSSEFDQPLPRVTGLDEGVDVDEVTDIGPGEQSFHPAGRHIVPMQHRPPLGRHWRPLEELRNQIDLALLPAHRNRDHEPHIGFRLLKDLVAVSVVAKNSHDPLRGCGHLTSALDRSKQVHIVTEPLNNVMGLNGKPAGQSEPEVVTQRFQAETDQPQMQLVHYAAADRRATSSGNRRSHRALAWAGSTSRFHNSRNVAPSRYACRSSRKRASRRTRSYITARSVGSVAHTRTRVLSRCVEAAERSLPWAPPTAQAIPALHKVAPPHTCS